MAHVSVSAELGGKSLTLETGKLARQANSVLATYGGTTILATVVVASEPREGMDFLPLKVDFDEKFYASGKIKGSRFLKREGRAAEEATLVARGIDRTMRPLFPKGFYNEVQVILTVLSFDGDNKADMVAAAAASAVLAISEAPFSDIVAMARVGRVNNEFVYNPTNQQLAEGDMNIIVGSIEDRVMMIEAHMSEVPEEEIFSAVEFCMNESKKLITAIEDLVSQAGKEKIVFVPSECNKELLSEIGEYIKEPMEFIYGKIDKMTRQTYVKDLKKKAVAHFTEGLDEALASEKEKEISSLYEKAVKEVIRENILKHERRVGGRNLDEIRPIYIEAGILPVVHGSGLFQRGETQGLTITTLGSASEGQLIDSMEGEETKHYMHHYNFPPFSVGDISTRRFTGNREIGHGFLAERALLPVLPSQEEFPYTIRLVTEILESNGSSSMAAACGSTLALMDAGVPIKRPVSGIAMGLITDKETGVYKVLTDLQDIEDYGGDMDFKVTGSEKGVTAIQVDMKIKGLSFDIVKDALSKSKIGRMEILKKMLDVIPEPRKELAATAPKIISFMINTDRIKNVIGKGGETINKIIDQTGVKIDINDDGRVDVATSDADNMEKAVQWIKDLTRDIEVGEVFEGKVVKVADFGAFVNLLPGKDALCHISQLANRRVDKVEEIVKLGDTLKVKVMEVDSQGRVNVSHKVLLAE